MGWFDMGGWKTYLGLAGKVLVLVSSELFGADAGAQVMNVIGSLSNLFLIWGVAHKIEKAGNGK